MIEYTRYSIIISLFWGAVYSFFAVRKSKETEFILEYGLWPLGILLILPLVRIFIGVELSFVHLIPSKTIYPAILEFFWFEFFTIGEIGINIIHIGFVVWIAGTLIKMTKFILNYRFFSRDISRISSVQGKDLQEVQHIVQRNKKIDGHKMNIFKSELVHVPFVMGFTKANIFIPDIAFSSNELECILLHEYQHFLNKDAWVKLLICCVDSIFWWNPMVYILRKRIDQVLEVKCDLETTKGWSDEEKNVYFNTIIMVMKHVVGMKQKNIRLNSMLFNTGVQSNLFLIQRYDLVYKYENKQRNEKKVAKFTFVVFIAFFLTFFVNVHPYFEPDLSDEEGLFFSEENAYMKQVEGVYYLYIIDEAEEFVYVIQEKEVMVLQECGVLLVETSD